MVPRIIRQRCASEHHAATIAVAISERGPFVSRVVIQRVMETATVPPSPGLHLVREVCLVVLASKTSAAGFVGAGWSTSTNVTHTLAPSTPGTFDSRTLSTLRMRPYAQPEMFHGHNPSPHAQRPPLPRSVWVLSWVSCFADISGEMVSPLLPLFLVGVLGTSKTQLGIIEGAAVLIVAVMTTYAGLSSDRSGRRVPWVRVGYGLPILGKAIIAFASIWPMVMVGRLLDRFGKGLRSAPRDALIADAVPAHQRGQAFGVHRAIDTAGALVGVLISAAILWWFATTPSDVAVTGALKAPPEWVFRAVFIVAAALGVVAFVVTFLVREPTATTAASPSPAPLPAQPPEALSSTSPSPLLTGVRMLPRRYWLTLLVFLIFALANSADAFLLLRASDLGFSAWAVVLLYAVFNVFYALLSYPAGILSDRLGRWAVIAAGWVLYAGVYAGFAWLQPAYAWGLWPLMACYGVSTALTEGVSKALITDHAPLLYRGTALGIFYASTGLCTLAASILAGVVWDRAGPAPAFLIGSGLAIAALCALGVLWLANSRHVVTEPMRARPKS